MTGLAVYTTDYTPRLVYSEDGAGDRDRELVERVVRYGDAPLDLLVEFDREGVRILWSFQGTLGSSANRMEWFVADFVAPAEADSFAAFEDALAAADGELRLSADDGSGAPLGTELAGADPGTPGLTPAQRRQLWDHLDGEAGTTGAPLVFGVRSYESAQAVVRAVQAQGTDCRLAVAGGGEPMSLDGVDLVLVVGIDEPFVPLSEETAAVFGMSEAGTVPPTTTPATGAHRESETVENRDGPGRLPVVLAVSVVVLYVGGTVVLYRGNAALTAIAVGTACGVVATGLVLGTERLAAHHRWLAGVIIVLLATGGAGAGLLALLHAVGVVQRGFLGTIIAGAYLGFVASFGLYVAGTAILSGSEAVVPALRSLVSGPLSPDHR